MYKIEWGAMCSTALVPARRLAERGVELAAVDQRERAVGVGGEGAVVALQRLAVGRGVLQSFRRRLAYSIMVIHIKYSKRRPNDLYDPWLAAPAGRRRGAATPRPSRCGPPPRPPNRARL
jgi:hypothetical protein